MAKIDEIAKERGISRDHLVEALFELTLWPYEPIEEAIKKLEKMGEV